MKKRGIYIIICIVVLIFLLLIWGEIRNTNSNQIEQLFREKNVEIHPRNWEIINFNLSSNSKDIFYIPITWNLNELKFSIFGVRDSWEIVYFFDWYSYEEIDGWENMDKVCNNSSCFPRHLNISDYYSGEISVYVKTSLFWVKEYREINLYNNVSKLDKKTFYLNLNDISYWNRYNVKMRNNQYLHWNIELLTYPKWKIEWLYIVLIHSFGEDDDIDAEFFIVK